MNPRTTTLMPPPATDYQELLIPNPRLRALSMTQPWASLVMLGFKFYETRSWHTPYRGLLLLHATKNPDLSFLTSPTGRKYNLNQRWPSGKDIPLGAIIGAATLQDCVPTSPLPENLTQSDFDLGDWTPGRFAWHLANVIAFNDPIPCRGFLQLWQPPSDIDALVRQVLADPLLHTRPT